MFGLYEKQNKTSYKQMGGVRFRRFFHYDYDDNGHFGQWKITDETLTPNFEIYISKLLTCNFNICSEVHK